VAASKQRAKEIRASREAKTRRIGQQVFYGDVLKKGASGDPFGEPKKVDVGRLSSYRGKSKEVTVPATFAPSARYRARSTRAAVERTPGEYTRRRIRIAKKAKKKYGLPGLTGVLAQVPTYQQAQRKEAKKEGQIGRQIQRDVAGYRRAKGEEIADELGIKPSEVNYGVTPSGKIVASAKKGSAQDVAGFKAIGKGTKGLHEGIAKAIYVTAKGLEAAEVRGIGAPSFDIIPGIKSKQRGSKVTMKNARRGATIAEFAIGGGLGGVKGAVKGTQALFKGYKATKAGAVRTVFPKAMRENAKVAFDEAKTPGKMYMTTRRAALIKGAKAEFRQAPGKVRLTRPGPIVQATRQTFSGLSKGQKMYGYGLGAATLGATERSRRP